MLAGGAEWNPILLATYSSYLLLVYWGGLGLPPEYIRRVDLLSWSGVCLCLCGRYYCSVRSTLHHLLSTTPSSGAFLL